MLMALRVYAGKEIVKEYSADEYAITVGVCEDVFRAIDVDALMMAATDDKMAKDVARNVLKAFMDFYPIAKGIFPDLTEDEYRHCLPKEVSKLMWNILQYAFSQLNEVETEKNRA